TSTFSSPFDSALLDARSALAFSKSVEFPLAKALFTKIDAMKNDTTVAISTEIIIFIWSPGAAIDMIAIIDPGDAADLRPVFNNTFVNTPAKPPAITAKSRYGFIRTYGK